MRTEFLCISVLRVASGPRMKLAGCKSVLNPPLHPSLRPYHHPVVYSTDRSKAVVPAIDFQPTLISINVGKQLPVL